jgi:hypothetical protein
MAFRRVLIITGQIDIGAGNAAKEAERIVVFTIDAHDGNVGLSGVVQIPLVVELEIRRKRVQLDPIDRFDIVDV